MMYFLIGGMLSNRMEDVLIASIIGFVLFLAAIMVKNNALEMPKLACGLLFFWPLVAVLSMVMMLNNLSELGAGASQFFSYMQEFFQIRGEGRPVPEYLHRSFFLSGGVITAALFIVAQIGTCLLLFVGTKPVKKNFRH